MVRPRQFDQASAANVPQIGYDLRVAAERPVHSFRKLKIMGFHVSSRWGGHEAKPTVDRLRAILAELDANDDEHPDVALTHESEWCLSAFPSGLLIWENLEQGGPRHMNGISRERVLALWLKLAQGHLDDIEAEPWLPGQYDPPERDTDFPQSVEE